METPKPAEWTLYFQQGMAFLRWKDFDEAILCFERAEKLHPCPEVMSTLGSLLFFKDRVEEAERVFQKGLKLFPNSKEIHFHFAGMRTDQGRWDEAISLFKRNIELDPQDAHSHRGLLYCYEKKERAGGKPTLS